MWYVYKDAEELSREGLHIIRYFIIILSFSKPGMKQFSWLLSFSSIGFLKSSYTTSKLTFFKNAAIYNGNTHGNCPFSPESV